MIHSLELVNKLLKLFWWIDFGFERSDSWRGINIESRSFFVSAEVSASSMNRHEIDQYTWKDVGNPFVHVKCVIGQTLAGYRTELENEFDKKF